MKDPVRAGTIDATGPGTTTTGKHDAEHAISSRPDRSGADCVRPRPVRGTLSSRHFGFVGCAGGGVRSITGIAPEPQYFVRIILSLPASSLYAAAGSDQSMQQRIQTP